MTGGIGCRFQLGAELVDARADRAGHVREVRDQ